MYLEKLGLAYLFIVLATFLFACNYEPYSSVTEMLLASFFASMLCPIYWGLIFLGIEKPATTICQAWLIIGTTIMVIVVGIDKIKSFIKR
ncbi:hypothetical protein [Parasutterella secunda]|uniref:Uncharacterized protein n=1 Tax=Parasutterella secunda TaxID=626947 RepID=A0ABS2GTV3_9BURK|nr:hypothetical protein [Parasutterella secunda]MBM6928162.1 hypothetical protein [Parasutterella secunda]